MKKRKVAETIVKVIKVIEKQGLSFKEFRCEVAYNLINAALNHGHFLEIVLLITKSNTDLSYHITKAIIESEKRSTSGQTGRRNLFTFLSPTTVINSIQTIIKKI